MVQLEFSFILSRKSMFLLCLKNPLSANYDVGYIIFVFSFIYKQQKLLIFHEKHSIWHERIKENSSCSRSKLPSVKTSVGQNGRWSKMASVKIAVGQNSRRSKWPSVKAASVKRPRTVGMVPSGPNAPDWLRMTAG
jgi:hypothetical protein